MRPLAITPSLLLALALGGPAPAAAQAGLTPIAAIQGDGDASPLKGQTVTTRGVVTAAFPQGQNNLNGFFIQDATGDGDPATSEGLFVFDNGKGAAVAVGTLVEVMGEVVEYFGLTELRLATVSALEVANPPQPAPLPLPALPDVQAAADALLEPLEGMLLALPAMAVIGATNDSGEAYAVPAASGLTALYRGDGTGRRLGLTAPTAWFAAHHGDRVEDGVGVLAYTYGIYKVAFRPDGLPRIVNGGRRPPPTPTEECPAGVSVAAYNVENFFDPVNDPDKNDDDSTPTIEQYPIEVARRARSIAMGLGLPDVVALQEVENLRVLEDLVAEPIVAPAQYQPMLIEGPDARGIDVAFLFSRRHLSLRSVEQVQGCTTLDPSEGLDTPCQLPGGGQGWVLFGRPPLVIRLEARRTGEHVVAINNHFKSKSGGDNATQPYRVAQARHVHDLALAEQAADPTAKVIVLGDLNDFEDSAMIQELTAGGDLTSLWQHLGADDYSYNFNGVRQILDHVLLPPDLAYSLFRAVHINTDFAAPPPADTRIEVQRVSDHDPLLFCLALTATTRYRYYLPALANGAAAVAPTAVPSATPPPVEPSPTPDRPTAGPPASATPLRTPGGTTATPSPTPGAAPRYPLEIVPPIFYDGEKGQNEPDEYVEIRNAAGETVDLTGWHLISTQGNQVYGFPDTFRMSAGQVCRVYTNEDHPEHCGLNWRSGQAVWRNGGDKAELRNASGLLIDTWCYGDRCP